MAQRILSLDDALTLYPNQVEAAVERMKMSVKKGYDFINRLPPNDRAKLVERGRKGDRTLSHYITSFLVGAGLNADPKDILRVLALGTPEGGPATIRHLMYFQDFIGTTQPSRNNWIFWAEQDLDLFGSGRSPRSWWTDRDAWEP